MAESSNRQKDIFLKALDLSSPGERTAFLVQACGSNESLRRHVEAMLEAHATPDSFLEKPAAAMGPTIDDPPRRAELHGGSEGPGTRVGPYKLLQQLGEGGMGIVFLAEQQAPVRRMVALKIIKQGMDSGQIVARFESERQALALMDHPNIAKVLDAGTTDTSRPYFVMELIKGIPITRFCDQEHLTPCERLKLFIPVCQAVQHAHQKGIIHRDLKPSNVMIALYDGKPVPKVIDFGIAKATAQKLTERTLFTEVGSMVGTLEYMAPEQAELNNFDIDTRADIYALGVLLYELLTGSPPFSARELRSNAFAEMLRIIREVEPPRPSTKLSSSQELPAIAASRKLEPNKLTSQVQGDLDWIVMKCLEKERGRRYETANAVVQDIQRYLADEPVLAGPPSAGYRLRKFVKRNRGTVTAAVVVLATLLAGIFGTSWGWVEALYQGDAAVKAISAARDAEAGKARAEGAAHAAAVDKADAEALERLAAQGKADAETKARVAAEKLTAAEKKRADEAGLRLRAVKAHLALEKGGNRIDRGDVGAGLLWLARSLEESPDDEEELQQSLRRLLGGWGHEWAVPRSVLPEHGNVQTVAFSPDGRTFVTAGRLAGPKAFVQRWDAATFKSVGDAIPLAWTEIHGLTFSPDGRRLLIFDSAVARIWDLETGKLVGQPFGSRQKTSVVWITHAAFSPDGKWVALSYESQPSAVWDIETGKRKFDLHAEGDDGSSRTAGVVFSADGKTILSAGNKGIRRWSAETGELMGQHLLQTNGEILFAASADGRKLVLFSSSANSVFLETDQPEKALAHRLPGRVHSLALSKDGTYLAACFGGNGVAIWDWRADAPVPVERLMVHAGIPERREGGWHLPPQAAFGPDNKTLVTANGTCLLWDLPQAPKPSQFGKGPIRSVAFSPDGKTLFTAPGATPGLTSDQRWDVATGKLVGQPFPHNPGLWDIQVAFSPDGKYMASLGSGKRAAAFRLWDAATAQEIGDLTDPLLSNGNSASALAFSADSKSFVVVGSAYCFRWDLATRKLVVAHALKRDTNWILWRVSPHGKYYYLCDHQRTDDAGLEWWDSITGKRVGVPIRQPGVRGGVDSHTAVFSPDEKLIMTTRHRYQESSGEARLWDAVTGRPVGEPATCIAPTNINSFQGTAFAPDGKTFVIVGWSSLQLWDTATFRPIGKALPFPRGALDAVAFDPRGETVAVGTGDGIGLVSLPRPARVGVERMRLWVEVATWRELDAAGAIGELDAKTWRHRWERLQKLGGPPVP